ncbi:MAG: hypothetical protein GY832_33515 [Chloroflexi bacterium]|nr:hypothetical protein [Chloroflexota bacterium]
MAYFDESYLAIRWDEGTRCVVMRWKKAVHGQEFRIGLEKGLELVKEKTASRWLADVRNIDALSEDDQEWSNGNWFPRVLSAGIKRNALIVPTSTLRQIAIEAIMSKVEGIDLETAYFDNVEQAKRWLDS